MKKIFLVIIVMFLVTGCVLFQTKTSPTRSVESFFGKYQSLDNTILNQLDDVVLDEDLTTTQKDDYKTLMKKQYQNLSYVVKDEVVDGNNAIVTVEIEVYDFTKSQTDIEDYIAENRAEFEDEEGVFSQEKYMDYKLGILKDETDKVKYTLDLRLTKNDKGEWQLEDLTDIERQKIHGVYATT